MNHYKAICNVKLLLDFWGRNNKDMSTAITPHLLTVKLQNLSLNPSKGVSHTEKVQVKICANKWLLLEELNYFSQCCSDVYSSRIVLSIKIKKISKTTKNGQIIKIIMFEIFRRFKRVTFLNCKDLLLNLKKNELLFLQIPVSKGRAKDNLQVVVSIGHVRSVSEGIPVGCLSVRDTTLTVVDVGKVTPG